MFIAGLIAIWGVWQFIVGNAGGIFDLIIVWIVFFSAQTSIILALRICYNIIQYLAVNVTIKSVLLPLPIIRNKKWLLRRCRQKIQMQKSFESNVIEFTFQHQMHPCSMIINFKHSRNTLNRVQKNLICASSLMANHVLKQ